MELPRSSGWNVHKRMTSVAIAEAGCGGEVRFLARSRAPHVADCHSEMPASPTATKQERSPASSRGSSSTKPRVRFGES
jgi:hypothetical protein